MAGMRCGWGAERTDPTILSLGIEDWALAPPWAGSHVRRSRRQPTTTSSSSSSHSRFGRCLLGLFGVLGLL